MCVCVSHTRTCVLLLSSPSLSPRRHHYRSDNVKAFDLRPRKSGWRTFSASPFSLVHFLFTFSFFFSFPHSLSLFTLPLIFPLFIFFLLSKSVCERTSVCRPWPESGTTWTKDFIRGAYNQNNGKKLTREAGSKIILSWVWNKIVKRKNTRCQHVVCDVYVVSRFLNSVC